MIPFREDDDGDVGVVGLIEGVSGFLGASPGRDEQVQTSVRRQVWAPHLA